MKEFVCHWTFTLAITFDIIYRTKFMASNRNEKYKYLVNIFSPWQLCFFALQHENSYNKIHVKILRHRQVWFTLLIVCDQWFYFYFKSITHLKNISIQCIWVPVISEHFISIYFAPSAQRYIYNLQWWD